jgi:23S rRNA (adenine2503-C2)-methyltransferase
VKLVAAHCTEANTRYAVLLHDGLQVEAVVYRGHTLCVSTQVGCAVRCPFCASGREGLIRQLSGSEIAGQVLAARALGHRLQRVTISGVGEPLHNHAEVVPFVAWCRRERLAPSVTTTGGPVHLLPVWLQLPHNGLTISVHAGTEATRARLVPRGPTLTKLFSLLGEQLPLLSKSRRRKVALAYLLLRGENDSDSEVDAFLQRAVGLGAAIHLYALNSVPGLPGSPCTRPRYEQVYHRMHAAGLTVRMSSQARVEPNGGCGTLLAARRTTTSCLTHHAPARP